MIAGMMSLAAIQSCAAIRRALGMLSVICFNHPLLAMAGSIDTSGQAPYEQCGYCHEYDGNSLTGKYPKLAGQKTEYLIKQLRDYRGERRNGDGKMQGTVSLLSEQDINEVAEYFSAQKRTVEIASISTADSQLASEIYTKGIPDRQVIACKPCHQSTDTRIPNLNGQHAEYIAIQLRDFKTEKRTNDPATVMQFISKRLTDDEISALSRFIAREANQ
jgi:cytochrome c553